MKDFCAHAQSVMEMVGANRHDHEFLNIQRVVGMRTTIHDVHHWCWQQMRMDPAEIAPKRHPDAIGRSA